jgi:transketolase
VLFGYGPVLLAQAYLASELLEARGIGLRVVNLPWLNRVDPDFAREMLGDRRLLVTLDNHYVAGGQGDAICSALAERGLPAGVRVQKLGVRELPACGGNDEVLRHHGLDARSLADSVARELEAARARA